MTEAMNCIIEGDAIETLKKLDANVRFDAVISDPPYNIGMDFGNNSDDMDLCDYLNWSREYVELCMERLNAGGFMYVYGFSEILARVATFFPIEQQKWLVWHYKNKCLPGYRFWQRSHESILCMWNSKRADLHVDAIRIPYAKSTLGISNKIRKGTASRFGTGKDTYYNPHEKGALPRDVIKVPALASGAGFIERHFMCLDCDRTVFQSQEKVHHRNCEILQHPTQKPQALTEYLLNACIGMKDRGNSRLLIPFAGSGSECLVASRLGIEYLGIEINPDYVEFAAKLIELAVNEENFALRQDTLI